MRLRDLFSRKSGERAPTKSSDPSPDVRRLDLSALDECVGGRAATDGIGCYMQSEQHRTYG